MRTDTGLKDSYGEAIYEGDAIYDEVGEFFSYVVNYKGEWYAAHNPDGDALNGPLAGTVKRRCQVIHTDTESIVELWQAHKALLAACQAAREWLGDKPTDARFWPYDKAKNELIDRLEAAIAKATGE